MTPSFSLRAPLGIVFALAALSVVSPAHAHPLVERARAQYGDADFEGALATLAEVERATDLTRDDVLSLYATRALVRFAMSQSGAAELDLGRLASIERDYEPPPEMPPSLRRTLDAVRQRLAVAMTLRVSVDRSDSGVRASARVDDDVHALVRNVALTCRVDEGPITRSESASLDLAARPDQTVECRALAVGPGNAVLVEARTTVPASGPTAGEARAPSPRETALAGGGGSGGGAGSLAEPEGERDENGGRAWPWIVVGVAIAAGVAVAVIVVVLVAGGQSVSVAGPRFEP